MEVVLASKSPRRRELLPFLGIEEFKIIPAEGEEKLEPGLSPEETVMSLAGQKAAEVREKCGEAELIIAADTLVYLDEERLGKPADEDDAFKMLRALAGRKHTVYTGVALLRGDRLLADYEKSDVYFAEMTDEEILSYIATKEPMDKAGAYGAQGYGAVFVRKIDGDFFNVMGLPLRKLYEMLNKFNAEY